MENGAINTGGGGGGGGGAMGRNLLTLNHVAKCGMSWVWRHGRMSSCHKRY